MKSRFWDVRTQTIGPFGENEILFTAEFWMLYVLLGNTLTANDIESIKTAIESQNAGNGLFVSRDKSEPFSHDNMTGLICLSKLAGLDYHKKLFYSDMWRRCHPRDLIFYAYMSGGIAGKIATLFLPLLSIMLIESCRMTYKNIDGDLIPSTDGKLLTWLRLHTISMPTTKRICDGMIAKHFDTWFRVFRTYFREPEHDNNILANLLYNKK